MSLQVRSSPRDYRWLTLVMVAGYLLLVLVGARASSAREAWRAFSVPGDDPPFADMLVVTAGLDCARLGIDPLAVNPCDPWLRTTNYPRVWLLLGKLSLGSEHTSAMALVAIAGYLLSVLWLMGPLSARGALGWGVLLCSPAAMFAVERGNIDLILFVLLTGSLVLQARGARGAYALVVFSAILKLYPFAALITCLRERRSTALRVVLGSGAVFAAYLVLTLADLKLVSSGTPRPAVLSYGSRVIFENLLLWLGAPDAARSTAPALGMAVGLAVLAVSCLVGWRAPLPLMEGPLLDRLRLGAAVYVGTYMLGSNWDYRFIFLLFTVPLLAEWARSPGALRTTARVLLGTLVVALYAEALADRWPSFAAEAVGEACNWLLFAAFGTLLVATRPAWLRRGAGVEEGASASLAPLPPAGG